MSSEQPITVLLPVYNIEQYILPAMRSILSQTHKNFELLIIDDGSTDRTAEKIFSIEDPRIRYLKTPHGGLGNALNYGLRNAANDIVARMDGDDIALPMRLEIQLTVFNTLPENTILSCSYAMFTGNKIWGIVNSPSGHDEIVRRLPLHNELVHTGVMYNRNFILKQGGYWENIFEDYELWLRLKNIAHFQIVPEVLVMVHYRNDSLSRTDIVKQYQRIYELAGAYFGDDSALRAFGLNPEEILGTRAWREYFFGNKSRAREYWLQPGFKLSKHPRSFLGFLMTFLPGPAFIAFKENRLRFRVANWLSVLSHEKRELRKVLMKCLGSVV